MDFSNEPDRENIRAAVRKLCADFGDVYWREVDRKSEYPEKFVDALTKAGWLAALIPTEYGGPGLDVADAASILEASKRYGRNAATAHAQMYTNGRLLKHGRDDEKHDYLTAHSKGQSG